MAQHTIIDWLDGLFGHRSSLRDYVPNGGPVDQATDLRPAVGHERCGAEVGDDPQSGPLYCGDRAAWVADTTTGVVCACERHKPALERIIVPVAP